MTFDNSITKRQNKKPDYAARSSRFKRIGDRGEQIVLRAEKQYLVKNGQMELANLVDPIFENDDSAGFDILSYDLDGKERPIEVKIDFTKYW